MKKNKKGFSLVELIAVILLLSIMVLIAVPAYNVLMDRNKRNLYEQKLVTIRLAAERYAQEKGVNESLTVSVKTLVEEGYLAADEADKDAEAGKDYDIINPINNKSILCYSVVVTMVNDTYTSIVNEFDNCELADIQTNEQYLDFKAYACNDSGCAALAYEKGTELEWTNKDVLIVASEGGTITNAFRNVLKNGNYHWNNSIEPKAGTFVKVSNNSEALNIYKNINSYKNAIVKTSDSMFNGYIGVSVESGSNKLADSLTVRIDNEAPIVSLQVPGIWTNDDKEITIEAQDKGIGLTSVCVDASGAVNSTKSTCYSLENVDGYDTTLVTSAEELSRITFKLGLGYYNFYVEDDLGNVREFTNEKVDFIDKEGPSCSTSDSYSEWTNQSRDFRYICSDLDGSVEGYNTLSGCVLGEGIYTQSRTAQYLSTSFSISDKAGNTSVCKLNPPNGNNVGAYVDKSNPRIVELTLKDGSYSKTCSASLTGATIASLSSCSWTIPGNGGYWYTKKYQNYYTKTISYTVKYIDDDSGPLTTTTSVPRTITVKKTVKKGFLGLGKKCTYSVITPVTAYDEAGNTRTFTPTIKYEECSGEIK